MKVRDAKLRRVLAAEYVLGLLRGSARLRFEKLAAKDADLLSEQRFWESHLGRLGNAIDPVEPPETVWIGLSHHIGLIAPNKVVPLKKSAPRPQGASPWRVGAGIAAAIAVVVAVIVSQRGTPLSPGGIPATSPVAPPVAQITPSPAAAPTYLALLKMPDSDMQWTVSIAPAHDRMNVAAAGTPPALAQGHSIELWWLSPAGPVAIGVVPVSGTGEMKLPKGMAEAGDLKLALSLEPVGGSPTGQPTGPVLTSAAAVKSA